VEPADDVPGIELLNHALGQLAGNFDAEWGGFGGAPKFPQAMSLELVLRAHRSSGSADALMVVTTSLDAMASGGMYDHLGGGFARYSVDRPWLVPHFEKMLYDQALLIPIYLHAWQVTASRATARSSRRRWGMSSVTSASPRAGSRRPRTPTPRGPTATTRKAASTPGHRTRSVPSSPTPTLSSSGTA
jgi:hypothetical protein